MRGSEKNAHLRYMQQIIGLELIFKRNILEVSMTQYDEWGKFFRTNKLR